MNDVLFLYSRLNGFVVTVAEHIAASPECGSVSIVYWDSAKDTGNKFATNTQAITLIPRSSLHKDAILATIERIRPRIVYLSGWMDKDYIAAVRSARRRGMDFVTVCGIDDQWFGSARQWLGSVYFRLFYRSVFDFLWVAGKPQYHYARMMGCRPQKILPNLLSADTAKFGRAAGQLKRFVFFGRFDRVKSLEVLVEAYQALTPDERAQWPLLLIGDGEMTELIRRQGGDDVTLMPYLQPHVLADELVKGGVGLLTSTFEAWSVALHELASMGFPLIASQQCGATSEFLVHGYNGYLFRGGDAVGLAGAMRAMIALSDEQRAQMGQASSFLANRITPEISARSLLSLLTTPPLPE